jgi:hypothetical protein
MISIGECMYALRLYLSPNPGVKIYHEVVQEVHCHQGKQDRLEIHEVGVAGPCKIGVSEGMRRGLVRSSRRQGSKKTSIRALIWL